MTERKSAEQATPLLEWLVGGAGALLFCAMLAVLAMNATSDPSSPPSVVVAVERVASVSGGYVVEFVARNEGDTTAAMVEISGEAGGETRTATLDYLPPHSTRRGGLFFARDPRGSGLTLRAEGYQDP
ncbi:MAG TPA: hypothetical protein VEA80_04515 [Vitreimonas sp.]|uniref:hypothetical protein n=1 Tax=Vitreimonas sp. TaxID=3069702 RepID=UPI002D478E3E|nr:hypothetical protein [Vitreimonas sp.]HYD86716.1 hypothetical protein [Vitreimonas sp.]